MAKTNELEVEVVSVFASRDAATDAVLAGTVSDPIWCLQPTFMDPGINRRYFVSAPSLGGARTRLVKHLAELTTGSRITVRTMQDWKMARLADKNRELSAKLAKVDTGA